MFQLQITFDGTLRITTFGGIALEQQCQHGLWTVSLEGEVLIAQLASATLSFADATDTLQSQEGFVALADETGSEPANRYQAMEATRTCQAGQLIAPCIGNVIARIATGKTTLNIALAHSDGLVAGIKITC